MAGVLMPDSGDVRLGVKVSRSYFAQHQGETLNFNHTVLESLQESAPGLLRSQQRNILGAFLFSGDVPTIVCAPRLKTEKIAMI